MNDYISVEERHEQWRKSRRNRIIAVLALLVLIVVPVVVGLVNLDGPIQRYEERRAEAAAIAEREAAATIMTEVGFVSVAKNSRTGRYVYRETLTGFMYSGYLLDWNNSYDHLTPLYDPDTSLPLKYERYLELIEESRSKRAETPNLAP